MPGARRGKNNEKVGACTYWLGHYKKGLDFHFQLGIFFSLSLTHTLYCMKFTCLLLKAFDPLVYAFYIRTAAM